MTTCGGLDCSCDGVKHTPTAGGSIHKTMCHLYLYYVYQRFLEHYSVAKQSNIVLCWEGGLQENPGSRASGTRESGHQLAGILIHHPMEPD